MKKHLFAMMAFSAGLGCFAQSGSNGGGISADMLADIVASYKDTPADKAVMNALCANGIGKLAMNHENLAFVDTHFSNVVESKGITDQKSSGRCWMFTGMNVMRAKMISKYNLGAFEFSQAYTFFWDQLEKANLFLQGIIDTSDKEWEDQTVQWLLRNPLNDGGQFTGVSDCKMQEGSLRADVNVSVMEKGSDKLGTRTEMKNINSFKAIHNAVETEARRQQEIIEDGGKIVQETRRWDDSKGESYAMRSKEDAQDYKYFPDPDLPPVCLTEEYVENIRKNLPELPDAKKARYMNELGLSEYDTSMICSSVYYVRLFEKTVEITKNPKDSANWIMGELMKMLNDTQTLPENMSFRPESLGEIINLLNSNKISRDSAKKVFKAVFEENVIPADYVKENNMEMVSDSGAIKAVVEEVINSNQKAVDEYKGGKAQSFNFLIGQCMRALKGKAPASEVTNILKEILG